MLSESAGHRYHRTLGILMGLLVLASGQNVLAVIIGHGLFDASRFVLFHLKGRRRRISPIVGALNTRRHLRHG